MNYYDILEIEEDADSSSIKKAYKKLAKKFHPDLNPENVELAEKKFKQTLKADKKVVSDKKEAAKAIQEKMNKLKAQRLAKKVNEAN